MDRNLDLNLDSNSDLDLDLNSGIMIGKFSPNGERTINLFQRH